MNDLELWRLFAAQWYGISRVAELDKKFRDFHDEAMRTFDEFDTKIDALDGVDRRWSRPLSEAAKA